MSTYQTSAVPQQSPAQHATSLSNRAPPGLTAATSATGTPPAPDSKANLRARLRLPPTIDSALVNQAYTARQSFAQALTADQSAALQPDYRTPFQSANDVVQRLLPYHVWHVNEDDLRWALDKSKAEGQVASSSSSPAPGLTSAKRSRDSNDIEDECFPTNEETDSLFTRYSTLQARARKLRCQLTGGASGLQGTLFYQESLYNIEKLAVEQERELLAADHEKLRQAKEKAIENGVSWDALMRLGPSLAQAAATSSTGSIAGSMPANGYSPMSFQKSIGSIQVNNVALAGRMTPTTQGNVNGISSLPTTPTNPNAKPRGRPRKNRDQDGKIIPTPPTIKPAEQQQQKTTSNPTLTTSSNKSAAINASKLPKTPAATSRAPPPAASPSTPQTTSSPATMIPSHPIPLVLPLSTLPTLSSLGIAPVPAPHLLPAISAQQSQRQSQGRQSGSSPAPPLPIPATVHSTAPRPAPLTQQEPALLMGITEAPLPRNSANGDVAGSMPSTQQMLHVSVVLSKLSPSQLSGLATLMQSLQANGGGGGGGGGNQSASPSNNSAAATPSSRSSQAR